MGKAVPIVQKLFSIEPLNKSKKIASPENVTTERMSSGPSLYYDGFGSYEFQTTFHLIKTLKEI